MAVRKKTMLVVAGIASFIIFAIAFIPASVVTNRLSGHARIGGVEGSLWSGHVRSMDFNGWQLRDTGWDLNPAALLLGRLSANVATRVADSEINADTSISLLGSISVRDLEASGPLAPLVGRFNLPANSGRYRVELSALDIADNWPTRLIGSAHIIDVPLNIMGNGSGPTGNYSLLFDVEAVTEDGLLSGELSDDGGPVEVGGNILLTPPANYELQAKIKARPGAPADIVQALNLAGPVGPDGRREISIAGTL